jgi:hypothetical protein
MTAHSTEYCHGENVNAVNSRLWLSLQLVATLVDGQSTCISSAINHDRRFLDWDQPLTMVDLNQSLTSLVDGWVVVDPTRLSNTTLVVGGSLACNINLFSLSRLRQDL